MYLYGYKMNNAEFVCISLDTERILLNFGRSETDEILELLQLDLPQSVTRSAKFTVSDSSNVLSIAPGTCTG
jgi:hypothetical protein